MYNMFYNCSNLISLDLSHFNTSSVTDMEYMFYGCSNLISLDLSDFNTSSNSINIDSMFDNCNNNLIYCIKDNNIILEYILSVSSYQFKNNNNCSDICFNKNKKIILDTKKCVLNCTNNYTYEYKNICYSSCPNGTYNISTSIPFITELLSNNVYSNINNNLTEIDFINY